MRILLFTLSYLLCSFSLVGQDETSETYYRDFYKQKKIAKKERATYMEVMTTSEDSIQTTVFSHLWKKKVYTQKSFKNGRPVGKWINRDEFGDLISERDFDKLVYSGKTIDSARYFAIDSDTSDSSFIGASYDEEGGAFMYLARNLRYPSEAKAEGAQGTVYVQIKVAKDGDVSVVSILRGANPYLDYEAFEVCNSMPDWTPSYLNGEPIDSFAIMPIKFSLR